MNTEIGQIARMIRQTQSEMTPLQQRLSQLGKILILLCLGVCLLVTFLGILRGEALFTMFMAGISLAVAAIPEGLPAVVTVALALGVKRMVKKKALVRKLPAVETLGCTTVICSDKTGTLTKNQMTVQRMATYGTQFTFSGNGYERQGKLLLDNEPIAFYRYPVLEQMLEIAVFCNNAQIKAERNTWRVQGDATEAALLIAAEKAGCRTEGIRLKEYPFDSERKCMSVIIEKEGKSWLLVKGALDAILPRCKDYQDENGRVQSFKKPIQQYFLDIQQEWGEQALRVLAFAWKEWKGAGKNHKFPENPAQMEKDLIFCGLCGMIDPPRSESKQAVKSCIEAGIVPVMITGDHPTTAGAINTRSSVASNHNRVITGHEIDQMNDAEVCRNALEEHVFARVEPQHKHRIVQVLQKNRQVVAMTGDGVNDAPALKAADIGIAMGKGGTQVAREASAMVLMDDNFSTIVEAIRVGRGIYDNIRNFIRYLLGSNVGEVLLMFIASLFGMPLPVLPIQILWVNLVTDGLPAIALGLEPPAPDVMQKNPRMRDEEHAI